MWLIWKITVKWVITINNFMFLTTYLCPKWKGLFFGLASLTQPDITRFSFCYLFFAYVKLLFFGVVKSYLSLLASFWLLKYFWVFVGFVSFAWHPLLVIGYAWLMTVCILNGSFNNFENSRKYNICVLDVIAILKAFWKSSQLIKVLNNFVG